MSNSIRTSQLRKIMEAIQWGLPDSLAAQHAGVTHATVRKYRLQSGNRRKIKRVVGGKRGVKMPKAILDAIRIECYRRGYTRYNEMLSVLIATVVIKDLFDTILGEKISEREIRKTNQTHTTHTGSTNP